MHNVLSCPTLEDEDAAVIEHYTRDLGDDGVKSHGNMSCDAPPWSSDAVIRHQRVWYVHCDLIPLKTDMIHSTSITMDYV